ncbi:MAG: type II secretion system F family protein [Rickettsiales bacterium]|nr:type II secretion system F family protein [Rickettsiales bacterium]
MPLYSYFAISKDGKENRGKMTANNVLDLEARIKELDCDLVDYKLVKEKKAGIGAKVKPKDMIMLCVHMEELERAGVPILDSLIDLRDSIDNPRMRDLLSDLCQYIKGGEKLSSALSKRKDVFDELFISLVSAGEETGNLADIFGQLSKHIKWTNDFRRKVKKAITYPIVLIVVMTIVISLMMLFVVPQLVDFLQKQGFDLPFHTRALIATSNFFADYWWVIIFGIPAQITILILLYKRHEPFRKGVDRVLLKVPGIGPVIQKVNIARFVKFFSITFNSGLGVLESLDISGRVVTNRVLKESIEAIKQNISEGVRITEALAENGSFPSLVVRMFKVGEDSGNMERSLANINYFYEREIDDAVEAMVAMIQPTLLVVMGSTLMWVIAAVFGPVYSSFSKMKF